MKEKSQNSKNLHLVTELKEKLETELTEWCERMLKLIDNYLIKRANSAESKVFYLKMKGDYYRYIAEFSSGEKHNQVASNSLNSYKEASNLAAELACTNPIKLGLALNFSVFYYEVMNDPATACQIANQAFQEGIQQLEKIEDDQYKDSTTILQLLKENIDMWSVDLAQEQGDEEVNEL
jgi:14-3-3 protein epsilon